MFVRAWRNRDFVELTSQRNGGGPKESVILSIDKIPDLIHKLQLAAQHAGADIDDYQSFEVPDAR